MREKENQSDYTRITKTKGAVCSVHARVAEGFPSVDRHIRVRTPWQKPIFGKAKKLERMFLSHNRSTLSD